MSDDEEDAGLEVYAFQGQGRETVPQTVEKLIVKEGLPFLRDQLCYHYLRLRKVTLGAIRIGANAFYKCENLVSIKIRITVQFIGKGAFKNCRRLKKIEFEGDGKISTTSQLQSIDAEAFLECYQLPRIKLPSSVTKIGGYAFDNCNVLMEANLSATALAEVPHCAFYGCSSLQTVSLPNTLEEICPHSFNSCSELVTVIIPTSSCDPIKLGQGCFDRCRRLANLVLPKGSYVYNADQDFFRGCDLLHDRLGEEAASILVGLISRFDDLPIHKLCYDPVAITPKELRQKIIEEGQDLLMDNFDVTVFHVFFSTLEPNVELLEVLLDHLPHYILKWRDGNGKLPLDYLVRRWNDDTSATLFQITVQKWMIDGFSRMGAVSWMQATENQLETVMVVDLGLGERWQLYKALYSTYEGYELLANTSILELALWKERFLKSDAANQRLCLDDREEHRCLCGANIVIPNVVKYLI